MKVGIGYSNTDNSFESGRIVATSAMEHGGLARADFVISFYSDRLDGHHFLHGMRSVLGPEVPIVGGAAVGVITNEELTYLQHQCSAAVFQSDDLRYEISVCNELGDDEFRAGQALINGFQQISSHKLLLLFYDSIKKQPDGINPPVLNSSLYLLNGIDDRLRSAIPVIGAGLHGSFDFTSSRIFTGHDVRAGSALGVLMSGRFSVYHRIMHGCSLLDGIYHTITKIEGSVVYEIDGINAVDFFDMTYKSDSWRREKPVRRLNLGINYGEKFDDYNEANYVNRLVVGPLPDKKGIVLFEPDLHPGTEIQIMLRDNQNMIESSVRNTTEIIHEIESLGKRIVFGLYIDCAGRSSHVSDTLNEEASEVQAIVNKHKIPFLGFYAGVEVAPFRNQSRGLDWTGVLLLFAED